MRPPGRLPLGWRQGMVKVLEYTGLNVKDASVIAVAALRSGVLHFTVPRNREVQDKGFTCYDETPGKPVHLGLET